MSKRGLWLVLLLMILGSPAFSFAADALRSWHQKVETAWKEAQARNRPLVVFVTHAGCGPCQRMKADCWRNPQIAKAVEHGYVPLQLDAESDEQLLKDLNVQAFPTTVVISPKAVVVGRIEGYVEPEKLLAALESFRSRKALVSQQRPR